MQLDEYDYKCSARDFKEINNCEAVKSNLKKALLALDVSKLSCKNEFSPFAPGIQVEISSNQNFLQKWWNSDSF